MQQKNSLIAISISIAFLLLWYTLVVPRFTPPPKPESHDVSAAKLSSTETSLNEPGASTNVPAPAEEAEKTPAAVPDQHLRNPLNDIAVTSAGGAVRHWTLSLKGQDIDLVQSSNAPPPFPLSTFPDVRFNIRTTADSVIFKGNVASGVQLTKTLTLSREGFLHNLVLEFKNSTNAPVELRNWEMSWGPGIGTVASELKENNKLIRMISLGDLHAHNLKQGENPPGKWAAIDNRYFMVAFIPPPDAHPTFVANGVHEQSRIALRDTTKIPAGGTVRLNYEIYCGPKGYTQLKHYKKDLEEGVDFGFFSPIGKLILSAVYRLQQLTGNYGWAIVILTIGLQLLMFPLTMKSLRAQIAMRKLQPQMTALQKKHKGDPKQLNVEMMSLYKTTGTNPFGGCLPMLLQLPIFWALFTALRNAYELRGAPFVGWIHDLAAPDPLHILPIVMGGAMFVQQRATGSMTDPTQRQMMFIMPIVFTAMFFNFPSGLVLYWLTNNLIMLLFQFLYQRRQGDFGKGTPDSPQIVRR
jgi:YidC/Oxa1 family membrane protein insertase